MWRLLSIPILGLLVPVALGFADARATTLSFTGEKLFNDPNVSFPTTTPTLNGTSLVFGPGLNSHEKLLVLPLVPAGTFPTTTPTDISVSIELTRLACGPGPCEGGAVDFDPHILISDGTNLIGALTADNSGGQFIGATLVDSGTAGTDRTTSFGFIGAGYPSIGEAFEVQVDFTLESGLTTVDGSFLGGSGSFSDSVRALDAASALSFVFMRDNDVGEQYQINSLVIRGVPEPTIILFLGLGLAGLGLARRKSLFTPTSQQTRLT